jgi:two-component system NtrC family sensor kinase
MESFETGVHTRRSSREWNSNEQFTEWEIYTHPVHSLDAQPLQVILVEEDVTEKRNLESNLIQSEKLAAVGHLAAGVAHEINNPLAAIIANAQILKRELPKDKLDWVDSISLIEMAGGRAAQVVSNLLEIAHKDQQTNFEPISLNDTIESALALVHHEITSRSIEINLDLQQGMPAMLGSKNQLQGVWINLLVNCFDAVDKPQGIIRISTQYVDRTFRVVVADNGKGIPQEHLNRIFTPFFTTKMVGKGTGLGLSVSQRAVKDHQGNMQVESIVGQGTKITIVFQDVSA